VTCEQLQLGLPTTVLPLRLPDSVSVVYDTFTCHGNEHRLDNCVINSATCEVDTQIFMTLSLLVNLIVWT